MTEQLYELFDRGILSIEEVSEALKDLSFVRLNDEELVEIGRRLLEYPTLVEEGTKHSGYYKKGFDLVSYYHGIKGRVSPRMADNQAQRLLRFRNTLNRSLERFLELGEKQHDKVPLPIYNLSEVVDGFKDLNIHDGRRLTSVLESTTKALYCPKIVPENAIEVFGGNWYNVKQFHADFEYRIKKSTELRSDGRKRMFIEGIEGLDRYLGTEGR